MFPPTPRQQRKGRRRAHLQHHDLPRQLGDTPGLFRQLRLRARAHKG